MLKSNVFIENKQLDECKVYILLSIDKGKSDCCASNDFLQYILIYSRLCFSKITSSYDLLVSCLLKQEKVNIFTQKQSCMVYCKYAFDSV